MCSARGLHEDDVFRVDLCASELLANVVEHGRASAADPVQVFLTLADGTTVIEVRDGGAPFDPLQVRPAELPATLADAAIGGHGLRLVRTFADGIEYIRSGDRNVVRATITHAPAAPPDRVPRGAERRASDPSASFPFRRGDGTVVARDERSGVDRRLLGFISTFAVFRGVPYAEVEGLVASCPVREFSAGEVLLEPGERNHDVLLVIEGRLRVHLDSPGSDDFVSVGVGECVGEMSIIDGKPVSAYVVAEAGCRLLVIDETRFLDRVLAVPRVARNLMSVLAERMRRGNVRELVQLRAALELEGLRREMRFAHDIQMRMLPSRSPLFPERADVDCDGLMRASREVGGDFFDAFFVDGTRLFFAVGDVCGKGMAAALFMVRTLTLLRPEAGHGQGADGPSLEAAVERFNARLHAGNDAGLFATLFVGVLDTRTGDLAWVNAGHPAPLVASATGRFGALEGPSNFLVGVEPDLRFRSGLVRLAPGSVLLLYSDGVTEAENAVEEMFGEERLARLLDGTSGASASRLVSETLAAVEAFAGGRPQSDDITVLALRYLGP